MTRARQPSRAGGSGGRRPTMVDVARQAGVALRTVSRVVNEDPTVGDEFAIRVRAAIATLGYQPDERARQLRLGVSGTLGVVVRGVSYSPRADRIERTAREAGFMILAASTQDDEQLERRTVLAMCRHRVDGIILEPIGTDHQYLLPELAAGLTLVAIDRPLEGMAVDTVLSDNVGGIRAAYEHLASHGHHRIGYIGNYERIYTGRERASAFRACVKEHGGRPEAMVHAVGTEPARIRSALENLLAGRWPATAIVTGSGATSVEVLRQLGSGTSRIAIVGFDDLVLASLLRPGLTVVSQDNVTIGRTAVELLMARRADPSRPVRHVTVPVELIPRGSGELVPAARPLLVRGLHRSEGDEEVSLG